jgi:hypothetical protein
MYRELYQICIINFIRFRFGVRSYCRIWVAGIESLVRASLSLSLSLLISRSGDLGGLCSDLRCILHHAVCSFVNYPPLGLFIFIVFVLSWVFAECCIQAPCIYCLLYTYVVISSNIVVVYMYIQLSQGRPALRKSDDPPSRGRACRLLCSGAVPWRFSLSTPL